MKSVYPIVIYPKAKNEKYNYVYVPDFENGTQGENLVECIDMARDLIGSISLYLDVLPIASKLKNIGEKYPECTVTLVDIDVTEYKKIHDNRATRRNVTLPFWLDQKAKASGINVSALLQKALKEELNIE